MAPGSRHQLGSLSADTARGAGDQGDLAIKTIHFCNLTC
jgi:hypothetical protein